MFRFGLLSALSLFLVDIYGLQSPPNEKSDSTRKQWKRKKNKFLRALSAANMPDHTYAVSVRDEGKFAWKECNMWMDKTHIHLFPTQVRSLEEDYDKIIIPLEGVLYYKQFGYVIPNVVGSGGGSSYSALTGAHGKINPIHISTSADDMRSTQLFYRADAQNQSISVLVLAPNNFEVLKLFMPDKDYAIIEQRRARELGRKDESADFRERLENLKSMYASGHITEEEYKEKRQELLHKIAD